MFRPPLVLLHGLTFDRTMWEPALAELAERDPGRRALAFDLPGHGESPAWESYDIESVADGVHRAVEEAGLDKPVIVGHSISAIIATVYAGRFPAPGIINVDQPLQTAAFAGFPPVHRRRASRSWLSGDLGAVRREHARGATSGERTARPMPRLHRAMDRSPN